MDEDVWGGSGNPKYVYTCTHMHACACTHTHLLNINMDAFMVVVICNFCTCIF